MLKTSLRYFSSVASSGSIRAASAALNVAQSAVSRQLQSLEFELGMELFDRHSRGVALTEAGQLLFTFTKNTMLDVDRLRSELDELLGLERGHVRICAIETMVHYILPRALMSFQSLYPGITYSVTIATTDEVVQAVQVGQADLGLGFSPIVDADIRLLYERVEPLLAVMSPMHPLAPKEQVSIIEVARYPVALSPSRSGARIVIDRACRNAGIKFTPQLETNSVELLHRFATLGGCVAPLLRHTVSQSMDSGQLRVVPFSDPEIAGTVTIMALEGRSLPLAAEKMAGVIAHQLDATSQTHRP